MTPDKKPSQEETGPDLLSDCRLMLRFARREGRIIPPELSADIAQLDAALKHLNLPAVSTIPEALIPESQTPAGAQSQPSLSPTELILKVHGALSQIVAPATALSLQVSEPPPGPHQFLGGMPRLVKYAAWAAVISAIGFVITSIPVAKEKLETMAAKSSPTPSPGKQPASSPSPEATR
jgi:hypothetical protein